MGGGRGRLFTKVSFFGPTKRNKTEAKKSMESDQCMPSTVAIDRHYAA